MNTHRKHQDPLVLGGQGRSEEELQDTAFSLAMLAFAALIVLGVTWLA